MRIEGTRKSKEFVLVAGEVLAGMLRVPNVTAAAGQLLPILRGLEIHLGGLWTQGIPMSQMMMCPTPSKH